MWVIIWYEEERFLGQVLRKVKGEIEVRCLKKPFGISGEPQDFEDEKYNCFYKKVFKTTVIPKSIYHKRKYRWLY